MTQRSRTRRRVLIGLGSNLDDRIGHLRRAVEGLAAAGVPPAAISSLYDTAPWGVVDQPRFLNAAVLVETDVPTEELLELAKRLEAAAGRDAAAARWSARPLDVDLLLAEGEIVESEHLTLPHPRLHERAFVLEPLAELVPSLRHPLLGRTVSELLADLPPEERAGVARVGGPDWAGER